MVSHNKVLKEKPNPIASGSAFIGLCQTRSNETQLRWQGAQLVVGINPPAFVAISLRLIAEHVQTPELLVLAGGSFVASLLNLFWYRILARDGHYIDFWNAKIRNLEERCGIEGSVAVFNSAEYDKLQKARKRLQNRLQSFTKWLIVIWAAFGILALDMVIHIF